MTSIGTILVHEFSDDTRTLYQFLLILFNNKKISGAPDADINKALANLFTEINSHPLFITETIQ